MELFDDIEWVIHEGELPKLFGYTVIIYLIFIIYSILFNKRLRLWLHA